MPPASSLVNKLKVQLRLSISRLRMVQQKDAALAKQQRRAMAQLLEQGKEESARIRVENIIRSDMTTELLEILELYCELLLARAGLLESSNVDPGLEEAIVSLIYAAPRLEVRELALVRQLLGEKYGKDFAVAADLDAEGKVAKRVRDKLRVEPPDKDLVDAYLSAIADAYDVDWPRGTKEAARLAVEQEREQGMGSDDDSDDGPGNGEKISADDKAAVSSEELSKATPPRSVGDPTPVRVMPRSPTSEDIRPGIKLAPGDGKVDEKAQKITGKKITTKSSGGPGGRIPEVDELSKRFAQLKR